MQFSTSPWVVEISLKGIMGQLQAHKRPHYTAMKRITPHPSKRSVSISFILEWQSRNELEQSAQFSQGYSADKYKVRGF
jgi:hypothetical protein